MVLTVYVSAPFFAEAAESGDDVEKEMCAKLSAIIKKGNESYRAGEYAKARGYFTEQVSLSEGCGYAYGKPDKASTITVIPPFFGALKSRGHAACAKRCFGV